MTMVALIFLCVWETGHSPRFGFVTALRDTVCILAGGGAAGALFYLVSDSFPNLKNGIFQLWQLDGEASKILNACKKINEIYNAQPFFKDGQENQCVFKEGGGTPFQPLQNNERYLGFCQNGWDFLSQQSNEISNATSKFIEQSRILRSDILVKYLRINQFQGITLFRFPNSTRKILIDENLLRCYQGQSKAAIDLAAHNKRKIGELGEKLGIDKLSKQYPAGLKSGRCQKP